MDRFFFEQHPLVEMSPVQQVYMYYYHSALLAVLLIVLLIVVLWYNDIL